MLTRNTEYERTDNFTLHGTAHSKRLLNSAYLCMYRSSAPPGGPVWGLLFLPQVSWLHPGEGSQAFLPYNLVINAKSIWYHLFSASSSHRAIDWKMLNHSWINSRSFNTKYNFQDYPWPGNFGENFPRVSSARCKRTCTRTWPMYSDSLVQAPGLKE